MKMNKESLTFGKSPILLKDVDINNVLVSNKISSAENSYDDYKIKLLYIILPKRRAYVKSYDGQIKWMHFLIEDYDLLDKYNTI